MATQKGNLFKKYTAPPFSVLDARSGWWTHRKRQWLKLGIQSELGRIDTMKSLESAYKVKQKMNGKTDPEIPAWAVNSIFDPVLTELLYRWFCPKGGKILDPYAGGSVRGVVASLLNRHYEGWELRQDQILANRRQAKELCHTHMPVWKQCDSVRARQTTKQSADFILTCPPYGDLEVYSNDPRDISTMPYDMFMGALTHSLKTACKRLKNDRFLAIVVGDYRDKKGCYHGFVPDVIKALKSSGLDYYNEGIYLQALGTMPVRVGAQFDRARKLGKCHQNVLIFVKGDPVIATDFIKAQNQNDVRLFDDTQD